MTRVAIVGFGGMGTVHISNYKHIENAQVVAVCDAFVAEEKVGEVKLYRDLEEMLKCEQIDLVDICTPTFMHYEHIKTALSFGKNVVCEKPLSLEYQKGKEVLQMAKDKGVKLFVGHVLHYAKEVMALKEIISTKKYGEVLTASFSRLSASPKWAQGGWLFDETKSGGVKFDLHIHDLDLIVSLFGKPKECKMREVGNLENCHYSFNYDYDGKYVKSEAGWLRGNIPFTVEWKICFEEGFLFFANGKMTVYTEEKAEEIDIEEDLLIPTGINVPPTGMFKRELQDFLGSLSCDYVGCEREEELLAVLEVLNQL